MTYYCPSSARAHRDASSKHRTSKTEITPLGIFCQKAQLVSQYKTPLLLYGPLSTGFLRDHRNRCCGGEEENQGIIKWRKSHIRFSHFDFPVVQPRRLQTSLNTRTPAIMAAIGKGKMEVTAGSCFSRAAV